MRFLGSACWVRVTDEAKRRFGASGPATRTTLPSQARGMAGGSTDWSFQAVAWIYEHDATLAREGALPFLTA